MVQCVWAQTVVAPNNPNILVEGRTINKDNVLHFCYPGTAFTIKFDGSGTLTAKLKANAGYYAVSVDGGGFTKFSTHGYDDGIREFELANTDAGTHTVKLMLVTEAYNVRPEFHGFVLPSGAKVLKVDTKKRPKIEFIGNSITCGYGNEAQSEHDSFADSTSNFAKSFAGITIKNLDAISMVVARSGIGIYKNYGDTIIGSRWPMPRVYENALINDTTTKWDFSSYKPDVVVVGLGTNDLSENNYNYEKFAVSYIAFIKQIRQHYPAAKIVLLNSPMLHYQQAQHLTDVIFNSISAMRVINDMKIYTFSFQEQDDSLGYGADWHPSAKRAAEMARYLTYFLKTEILKIKK
jgi:hypothetical protein